LTDALLELGASSVLGIEPKTNKLGPNIVWYSQSFQEFANDLAQGLVCLPKMALVSWPLWNPLPGLVTLLEQVETVLYLGKNTDGTVCGPEDFWLHMLEREVLEHVPDRRNVLTVYGPVTGKPPREPEIQEERAALDSHRWWETEVASYSPKG